MPYVRNLHQQKTGGLNLQKIGKLLAVLLLSILGSPLCAAKVEALSIGTGNDWYTMGLGYNQDDGLSFGAELQATFDTGLSLRFDTLSYTERIVSQKRYDVLSLGLSYPYTLHHNTLATTIQPSVALVATGNVGMQDIQNTYHHLIFRDPVTLTYDTDRTDYHASLGLSIQSGFQNKHLFYGLSATYVHTFGWEQIVESNLVLNYGGFLEVMAGYRISEDADCYCSQSVQSERYQGLKLSYTYDGGFMQTAYFTYLESGFSYGGFYFDPLAFKKPKTFQEVDFTFTTGFLYDLLGQQNRLFAFSFGPVSFEIRHKNGPMFNLMNDQDNRINIGSWMLGYAWEWDIPHFRFTVYGKILGGLERFNLQQDFTQTLVEQTLPTVAVEGGLRFGKSGQWVVENQSYRFRLTTTLQYVFGTEVLPSIDYLEDHTGPWILMVGCVFDIEHDLTS